MFGLPFVVEGASDFLPIIAFVSGRFAEAQSECIYIYMLLLVTSSSWILYYAVEGMLVLLLSAFIGLIANIVFNYKDFFIALRLKYQI